MPSIYNRQTIRINVSFSGPEKYFKVSLRVYTPFLDNLVFQLILTYDFGVIFGGPLPWEISDYATGKH